MRSGGYFLFPSLSPFFFLSHLKSRRVSFLFSKIFFLSSHFLPSTLYVLSPKQTSVFVKNFPSLIIRVSNTSQQSLLYMPTEALSYRQRTHSVTLNIPPKQPLPSMEYYDTSIDRSRQELSMAYGDIEWNRLNETEGTIRYHTPYHQTQAGPQSLGRSNLILPPPSSLLPPLKYRPAMMTNVPQHAGYNVYVDQTKVKSTKRKRNPSPPEMSAQGCHYEVLNMTKRKRSKRDATAAETLASFSRLSASNPPYFGAEGPRCVDEYKHSRGRNKGDMNYHDSQSLVFEVRTLTFCPIYHVR
jgi:hypothetical protein